MLGLKNEGEIVDLREMVTDDASNDEKKATDDRKDEKKATDDRKDEREVNTSKKSVHSFIDIGERCWLLPVVVAGTRLDFLVDSGATKSLMDTSVFERCFPGKIKDLHQPNEAMFAANDTLIELAGEGEIVMNVGKKKFPITVVLANLGNLDGILGMDFLRRKGISLDLGEGVLKADAWSVYLTDRNRRLDKCSRMRVTEEVVIPAFHEVLIKGYVDRRNGSGQNSVGVLEPVSSIMSEDGLLVAKTVVCVDKNRSIPVTVANVSNKDIVVQKGTTLGLISPLEAISETQELTGNKIGNEELVELPEHLQPLIDNVSGELTDSEKKKLACLILEYTSIFIGPDKEMGHTDLTKHRIDTDNAKPIKLPPHRMSMKEKVIVDELVNDMLEKGVVEPSTSPWAAPVVLAWKKDGTPRFCVDYRKCNEVTRKDAYPLPRIDDTIDALAGSQWFCTMDLASGYWQVAMAEEDKEKTAFVTRKGLFHFNVMPFSLCNAPSTFERLMELVLKGLQWERCLLYINDILAFGKTFDQTLENLREVFSRLKDAGLKLKPSKCRLFQEQVSFLGHIVGREGVSCDPQKIEAVRDWETPKSVKEVRSFLGLASYYRKFIRGFSTIVAPLTNLTRKGAKFSWSNECEVAFQALKDMMISAPILAYPNESGEYVLDTDASNYGIGAVLSQIQNGQERVIAYASRTLSKSQRVYCTTYKELLSVRMFVEHFRCYLYGQSFTVRTDHASLTWLRNFKNPEGMVQRWIAFLDTFDMKWEHRKGELHGNADALSRQPPRRKCKYIECPDCGVSEEEFPCDCLHAGSACLISTEDVSMTNTAQRKADRKDLEPQFDNWLGQWSREELKTWQREDHALNEIIAWKEKSSERPVYSDITAQSADVKTLWMMWSELELRRDILYRVKVLEPHISPVSQCVAPTKLRSLIMKQLHDTRLGGHLGVTKTLARIKQRFYWPGCKKDVKLWCKKCNCCAQKNGLKTKAAMQHVPVGVPLQKVALDVMGPFPTSDQGNSYVLVVSDYFTRWVEAYAIPDQTAIVIADKFVTEFVTRYGIPEQIHTDQGQDFMSKVFTEMCTLLQVDKTRTTPYRPMSDGLVERLNRTIQQMLTSYINETRTDWEDHLPYILMAYRSTMQETTGCSPNLLMLGREVFLPLDLLVGSPPTCGGNSACATEYVDWLKGAMEHAFEFAKRNMKKGVERQKYNFNKKLRERKFKRGDWVWLYNVPQSKMKLGKPWTGPFIVVQQLSEVTYKLQRSPDSKEKVVHVNHLKMYEGSEVPESWLPEEREVVERENGMEDDGSESEGEVANSGLKSMADSDSSEMGKHQSRFDDRSKGRGKRKRRPPRRYSP
jgi:transposase InsO family protein